MIDSTNVLLRHHESVFVGRIAARLEVTIVAIADAYRHERPWLRFIDQRLASRAAEQG